MARAREESEGAEVHGSMLAGIQRYLLLQSVVRR